MFALHVCGVRLSVAADDLGVPAAVTLVVRLLWAGVSGSFFGLAWARDAEDDASEEALLLLLLVQAYAAALAALTVVTIALFVAVLVLAHRGPLLEGEKRAGMVPVLHLLIAAYLIEFAANGLGVYVLASWPEDAELPVLRKFTLGAVVLVFLDVIIFFATWLLFLNRNKTRNKGLRLDEFELKSLEWQARCRRWCNVTRRFSCGLYGYHVQRGTNTEFAFSQVGEVFASFFVTLKLTPTEFLAGLLLVKAEQATERRAQAERNLRISIEPHNKRVVPKFEKLGSSERNVGDTAMMQELFAVHDVLKYTECINSWKLYLLNSWLAKKPLTGVSKLVLKSVSHARHRWRQPERHRGDNCCAWNHTALVSMAGLKSEDLVFSHFASYATELVAFAVVVDHARETVALCFRGSLALSDFLTDAVLQPESLVSAGREWGFDGTGHYAHAGMLAAALKVRGILEETGILNRLFRREPDSELKREPSAHSLADWERGSISCVPDEDLPDCSGYKLVVVGESLGAGLAAIETLLLQPAFPGVKGFGVSTPGCIFSRELADKCSEYFTTVFVGKDLVPRANWQSLLKVRTEMLEALMRCKVNKNVVLRSAFRKTTAEDLMHGRDEDLPDSAGLRLLRAMASLPNTLAEQSAPHLHSIPMFCPGRILQIAKTQTTTSPRCCGLGPARRRRSYEPFWVQDRAELAHFELSSSMVRDHMPPLVRGAIEEVLDSDGP